ncbi:MAG TPA: glycine oxidase ThiO [Candidatus Acidoferrales bacterium]|jgi:glycine oxidase|nr:glycine oxidase ThiO [Candidatus Acidoferrales bacterium]
MDILGGDVVVAGAGLIGLAVAFELAERGATVRVFDTGEPGRAASWAGAGMLAPYTEAVDDKPFLDLCAASLAAYPAFVERVRSASGIDPKLFLDGIVNAAFDEAQLAHVAARVRDLSGAGVECELLDRTQTLALEPALGANVVGASIVRCEGSVDNRRLGRALLAACVARGVLVSQVTSIGVECDARRALGVRTDRGFVPASAVVNACGAWAGSLEGVPAAFLPPVFPVKGQMLALAVPDGLVRRPVWVPGAYLVPRDDGRLLVGATVESGGFDTRVTAEGMHALLDAALAAAPALRDFTLAETWAGLRPGSPDGRPFIGSTPLDGFYLATGHYRNGILLAPATATFVADAIADERSATEAFGLGRLISRV